MLSIAILDNYHINECKIQKSKIATFCLKIGLPKLMPEKCVLVCLDNYLTVAATACFRKKLLESLIFKPKRHSAQIETVRPN